MNKRLFSTDSLPLAKDTLLPRYVRRDDLESKNKLHDTGTIKFYYRLGPSNYGKGNII